MEKVLPLLNLLMRIKFCRSRLLLLIGSPVRLSAPLLALQNHLDKQGFRELAKGLEGLTLHVCVDVVPSSFAKNMEVVWQKKQKT